MGFDVETYEEEGTHVFYTGGLWWTNDEGEEVFKYFVEAEEMRRYMINYRFRDRVFIATNLMFDLTVLFYGSSYWNSLELITRSGDLMQVTYTLKQNNGRLTFLDTFNYVSYGVSKLGQIISIPKLEGPNWLGKRGALDMREYFVLKEYNKQDCKISCLFAEFLQRGINQLGGQLKITSASTSLDTFRRAYQEEPMIKEEYLIGEWVTKFIFEGYYGGRTEVFSRGVVRGANYYDVNSLYPHVMRRQLPKPQSVRVIDEPCIAYIKDYEGVSRVTVVCPDMKYPLLPYRLDGKLLFPTGEFTGTYNHIELRKALELGYEILLVEKQIIYTETFTPFKEYIEDLYAKRLQYKRMGSPMEQVTKLLMNSLYGKFAQKRREDFEIKNPEHFTDEEEKAFYAGEFEEGYDFKNGILMRGEEKEFKGKHSFPILSSYITSHARLVMYEYITSYDAIYTDTDSIITRHAIPTGDALGDMKLEEHVEEGYFIRPKFYMINEQPKVKGCTGISNEDLHNILEGDPVVRMRFSKLRESFRRGIQPNTVIESPKQLSLEDEKRVWSKPFNKDELQESIAIRIEEGIPTHLRDEMIREAEHELTNDAYREAKKQAKKYLRDNDKIKKFYYGRTQELVEVYTQAALQQIPFVEIDYEALDSENLLVSFEESITV